MRDRLRPIHPHHEQTRDHRDVAGAVGKKAPAFAKLRHQYAPHRRPYNARPIEHRRVQRNGVHQVLFADHLHQERLPSGQVESIHHAQQSRQHKHMRDLDAMAQHQGRKHQREQHGRRLRGKDDAAAIVTVGNDSTDGREQKYRDLPRKPNRSQQQPRSGHPVNQPRLRHALHPRAGQRNQLSGKEELKIAVAQRPSRGFKMQRAAAGRLCFADGFFGFGHDLWLPGNVFVFIQRVPLPCFLS